MKGYRTLVVNGLMIVSLCLASILAGNNIDPLYLQLALVAQAVVNIALRAITSTPMGQPKPAPLQLSPEVLDFLRNMSNQLAESQAPEETIGDGRGEL